MINITSVRMWPPCCCRGTKARGAGVNPTSSASASPIRKHSLLRWRGYAPPLRGSERLKTGRLMSHRSWDWCVNDVWGGALTLKVMDDKLRSSGNNMQQLHSTLKGCQRHCRSNCHCNGARIFNTERRRETIIFRLRLIWMKGWSESYLHAESYLHKTFLWNQLRTKRHPFHSAVHPDVLFKSFLNYTYPVFKQQPCQR